MDPKRILYVEGNVDGTVGGSYYVLYDLVINLNKKLYQPVVVFYTDNIIAEKLREAGIETYIIKRPAPYVFPIKNSSNAVLRTLYQCIRPLQRIINIFKRLLIPAVQLSRFLKEINVDLVNLNNSITRNHEWMIACRITGIDCMTHEMGVNRKFSWISRHFAPHMKAIITVSEEVKKIMQKHGLDHPNLVAIHNGLDLSRYHIQCQPDMLREELNISPEAPIIGVIGNIKLWKGQETVVRATPLIKKEFPEIRCLLVGAVADGDIEYAEKLQRLIKELDIEENIIFTGFRKNAIDFMNLMDIFIHPSVDPEPFGIVNLEAMFVKTPVISTTIGAPPEIFENGVSGILIEPGKPALLAEKCISLLRSPEKTKEMVELAYTSLIQKFTIQVNLKKTESAYYQLLYENSDRITL